MIPTAWFLTVKVMVAGGDFCKCSASGGLPGCGTLGPKMSQQGLSWHLICSSCCRWPLPRLPVPWFLVVEGWGPSDLLVAVVSTLWFPCMASARSPLQLTRG